MRERTRLIGTLIVWAGFAIITNNLLTSVTGPITQTKDDTLVIIVMLLAIVATICTLAIWLSDIHRTTTQTRTHIARGKRKRTGHDRLERLMAALDNEDIYDLEELLLSREEARQRENQQP